MYQAKTCPCCGHAKHKRYPAVMAPFIASYALGREPWATALLECQDCGFRFFEERFDADEEARLYGGYRGERYFRERHRFEWWYGRGANASLGSDADGLEFRKRRMLRALADAGAPARVRSVLDYGGDSGQFIPAGLGERLYVLDLSGVQPSPGVTALRRPADLDGGTVDLVMLCNILVHSPDPAALLAAAGNLLEQGGWLHIEVPLERNDLRFVSGRAWYRRYVVALARRPAWLRWVDFYSTLSRKAAGLVPPLGILKAHEHINFYDAASLARLLQGNGFAVAHCGPWDNNAGDMFKVRAAMRGEEALKSA